MTKPKKRKMQLRTQNIPKSYMNRSGQMGILKGKTEMSEGDKLQFYSWDAVVDCIHEECPAVQYCHLQPARDANIQKCSIQLSYVRRVARALFTAYDTTDEMLVFKIGMHLIPMYANLARLKIAELGVHRVTYMGNTGTVRVHPIYKELRDQHHRILWSFSELGLTKELAKELAELDPVDLKTGDKSLYSRMMESARSGRRE